MNYTKESAELHAHRVFFFLHLPDGNPLSRNRGKGKTLILEASPDGHDDKR